MTQYLLEKWISILIKLLLLIAHIQIRIANSNLHYRANWFLWDITEKWWHWTYKTQKHAFKKRYPWHKDIIDDPIFDL